MRRYVVTAMVAIALILIVGNALQLLTHEGIARDSIGYWNAGLHIRSGAPLYFDQGQPFGSEVFLFAPWFAWAWALLTFLPREPVIVTWMVLMFVATLWAVRPFFRFGLTGALLGCVLGYALAWGALWANVMPLLVGILIHTHGRRSFPVWVGLAASLKVLPILYVWPDVVDRRWRRVAVAIGIAAILWAPALLYRLSEYPTGYMPTLSLLQVSGWLWAAVAVAAVLLMVRQRHTRWRWLTTTLAILAIFPRVHLHYVGLLGIGALELGRLPEDPAAQPD